ncbi:hypothetical protein [Halocatena marina]|uniref:hypothetical protein n=1 Tax=Halocatena marina TaxID=2934937 RepID=UPI00200EDE14|nr:hypothetical protein [Halocatena marina]
MSSNTPADDATSPSRRYIAITTVCRLFGLLFTYIGLQIVFFALEHPITSQTFLFNGLLGVFVLYGGFRSAGVRFRLYSRLRSMRS